MSENWLPIPGYEDLYEVSDEGRVRSLDRYVNHWRGGQRLIKGRYLRTFQINKARERDYLRVGLYRQQQLETHTVHTLVLKAFVGPRPDGFVCCHRNGVSTDNRLENLRWDTLSANSRDDIRNGVHPAASKTHCKRGHEFNDENTIRRGSSRRCRTCSHDRDQQRPRMGRRTHCRRGHEFTPENTYLATKGRECRICRDASRERWALRQAAKEQAA